MADMLTRAEGGSRDRPTGPRARRLHDPSAGRARNHRQQKQQFEANAKQVEDDVTGPQRPAAGGVGAAAGGGGPGGAVVVNSFNSTEHEKVVREARAEGMKRALTILTDEQKAAWKKLSGEPFAYPLPLPASAMKGIRTGGFGFGGAGVRPLPPGAPGVPAPVPPPRSNAKARVTNPRTRTHPRAEPRVSSCTADTGCRASKPLELTLPRREAGIGSGNGRHRRRAADALQRRFRHRALDGRARPGADDHFQRPGAPAVAVRNLIRGSIHRVLAHHLAVANPEPQRQRSGAARPHGTRATVAADLHRFRTEVHRDHLSLAVAHFQPRRPERQFDERDHQPDAPAQQRRADETAVRVAQL